MGRNRALLSLSFLVPLAAVGCRTLHSAPTPLEREARAAARPPGNPAPDRAEAEVSGRQDADRGDPFAEARRRIEEAKRLPTPAGNYLVRVERVWFSENEKRSIGALFRYTDEHVDASVGSGAPRAGFRIGVTVGGFRAFLDGDLRRSRGATREEVLLAAAPGYPASLNVGRTRFAVPIRIGGRPGALVMPQGQFIGSSLRVLCRPAGEGKVEVALTPVFSSLEEGGRELAVTEATTRLVVPVGRPFLLAADESRRDSVASALLRRTSRRGEERAVLVLTVEGG